jgi:5'-nucleotidase
MRFSPSSEFFELSIEPFQIFDSSTETAKLKASGTNIIIALGHSGLERDKQIAAQCPEVDLVIGGHCK